MTVRIITDSNGRKHITSEPLLHQPAPVMTDEKGRPVSFWGGKSVEPIAQPAPVQPVASLKEVDVLMMAETHGIDPSTKGLYGFYIDCISNQPAARPAPVQEPVAWQVHPFDYGIGHEGVYARTDRPEQVEMWKRKGWTVQPLYTTPPAQPAVPDAIHHTDLSEHPQYIEGWNDCRAEMLKGMKP
jgi:hypothetical protein